MLSHTLHAAAHDPAQLEAPVHADDAQQGTGREAEGRLLVLGRKLVAAAADDAWLHQTRGPDGAAPASAPEGSSWEEVGPLSQAQLRLHVQSLH